jgi:phage shock protein C
MKNVDLKLYRSSNQAWLGGVCAGVAECYGQPVWLIRILMITLFVFSGSLAALVHHKPDFAHNLAMAKMPHNGRAN